MSIRISPFSNSEFASLEAAIVGLTRLLMDGVENSFTISLHDPAVPVLTYYVQAQYFASSNKISIEAQRNAASERIVLESQDLKARVYGWELPKRGEKNPNYRQEWDLSKVSVHRVAQELVEAIKFIGSAKPDSWFTISPKSLSRRVQESGLVWNMSGDNDYMCQAGHNIMKTTEGRIRSGIAA